MFTLPPGRGPAARAGNGQRRERNHRRLPDRQDRIDQANGEARGFRLGQRYRGDTGGAAAGSSLPCDTSRGSCSTAELAGMAASDPAPAAQQQGMPW